MFLSDLIADVSGVLVDLGSIVSSIPAEIRLIGVASFGTALIIGCYRMIKDWS